MTDTPSFQTDDWTIADTETASEILLQLTSDGKHLGSRSSTVHARLAG